MLDTEIPKIKSAAARHNVDWAFLAAIRQAENGGPGREFGVLSVSAPSYDEQLAECVATVAHRLESYPANPLMRCYGVDGHSRVRYNPSFISYFAASWAPIGANNDPNGLNRHWFNNVSKFYQEHVQADLA